ncbi:DUF6817 domain-containing protein [Streptomyces sp. NPDC090112]|uniref:DUF6817 domain-containing protein n=1 Tax=Streptomyces sp. NPDC090112 TaxID=3365949 RepID=UPI0038213F69
MPDRAVAWLREPGAAELAHPGGTLLSHLERVQDLLGSWGARPALRRAGLCHALYGTDGFGTALLPPGRRAEPAEVIGAEAEAIVYLYASCDRAASYPTLAAAEPSFRDRFTGAVHCPGLRSRRDLAELSAANELDLARIDPGFRREWGAGLLGLFTGWRDLLSEPTLRECRAVLGDGTADGDGVQRPFG